MTLLPTDVARALRVPGYVVAAVLAVLPIGEVAANAWPARWHEPPWRMALVASTASAATTMIFALFLLLAIGLAAGDRRTLWLVATASAVTAILSVVGTGAFALDSLQIRSQLQPGQASRFVAQSLWAISKIAVGAIAFLVLAFSAIRAAKKLRRPARPAKGRVPLVKTGPGLDATVRMPASPTAVDASESPTAR